MKKSTAVVIVHPDGRVLGVSRKDDHTAFGVPGGKFDPEDGDWENPDDRVRAALRELREETGVVLDPKDVLALGMRECPGEVTYMAAAFAYCGDVAFIQMPGEGLVAWITWEDLYAGPFGIYNHWSHERLSERGFLEPKVVALVQVEIEGVPFCETVVVANDGVLYTHNLTWCACARQLVLESTTQEPWTHNLYFNRADTSVTQKLWVDPAYQVVAYVPSREWGFETKPFTPKALGYTVLDHKPSFTLEDLALTPRGVCHHPMCPQE